MSQNIFDNDTFFEDYKIVRNKIESYNNLIEQPAMKSLLPDMKNKTVLDMGCGFGINCMDFVKREAAKVVGIDISGKMLDIAKSQNADDKIYYMQLDMERIDKIELKFDFVYSSLAVHYIADFETLIRKVYDILTNSGIFLFSQEHPLCTAPLNGPTWIKNEQGIKISSPVSNYLENGERHTKWMNEDRITNHRSFSTIVNNLVENGFSILKIEEPMPTSRALEIAPHMYDEVHRPTAIIFKAQKI